MIKIFTLSTLIAISLFSRVNPIEADESMIKNKVEINEVQLKPIPIEKPLENKDDGKRSVKVEAGETKKVKINMLVQVDKTKKIELTKEEIAAQCAINDNKNKILKTDSNSSMIIKPVVKIKKIVKKEFVPASYKILPFITIDVDFNNLKITSRKKYNIVTYHNLKDDKKIAFDFLADVRFYTRYKKLDAPNFKSYLIGNHKERGFFRVAITLEHSVKDYNIVINNNMVTIKKYKK